MVLSVCIFIGFILVAGSYYDQNKFGINLAVVSIVFGLIGQFTEFGEIMIIAATLLGVVYMFLVQRR